MNVFQKSWIQACQDATWSGNLSPRTKSDLFGNMAVSNQLDEQGTAILNWAIERAPHLALMYFEWEASIDQPNPSAIWFAQNILQDALENHHSVVPDLVKIHSQNYLLSNALLLLARSILDPNRFPNAPLHIELLKQSALDINASNANCPSLLDRVLLSKFDERFLNAALLAGADIHQPNWDEKYPLMNCYDNPVAAQILLDQGANPNATDHTQSTALMYACWDGCVETIQCLWDVSNPDEKNKDGDSSWTFLHKRPEIYAHISKWLIERNLPSEHTNSDKRKM